MIPETGSPHTSGPGHQAMEGPPEPGTPPAGILEAARTLFADRGFAATSTRSIAEKAGVNLAMIHYYFGNKEQLYRRVVELELAHLFRLIKETLQTESTPGGFFPAIPALLMNLHRQHPELRQIMMREIVDGSPRLPAMMKEMGENGPLGLKKLLVSQMETAGECAFPADIPPNHYLALIFAMGHGLMAFAPLLAVGFGLDLENEETAEAVGNSAGKMVRSTLSPVKEA